MRIISIRHLNQSMGKYPDSCSQIKAWRSVTQKSQWNNINQVKEAFPNVSILPKNRVVFNLKGNDYRLIAAFNFIAKICYIRWFGSHKEYDKIDATNI